jgi:hypothetical protein
VGTTPAHSLARAPLLFKRFLQLFTRAARVVEFLVFKEAAEITEVVGAAGKAEEAVGAFGEGFPSAIAIDLEEARLIEQLHDQ